MAIGWYGSQCSSHVRSMSGGESGINVFPSSSVRALENQFEELRHQLEDTGDSRERIRNISWEIESTTRLMHYSLLLIHQSQHVPELDGNRLFHSLHSMAENHGEARAVGGCTIYVSEKPGNHDFNVLKKLVLPDGSTSRAKLPERPTIDRLFTDPTRDGRRYNLGR